MRKLMIVAVVIALMLFSGVFFSEGRPPKPAPVSRVTTPVQPDIIEEPAPVVLQVSQPAAPKARNKSRQKARRPAPSHVKKVGAPKPKPQPVIIAELPTPPPGMLSCVCVDEKGQETRVVLTKKKGFWGKVGGGIAKPFKAVGHLFHHPKKDKK